MEIPFLKTAVAAVSSIVIIIGAGFKVDDRYISVTELETYMEEAVSPVSEQVEKINRFIPEWKQQRIWDMEENVEKSTSEEERRRWMRRLKQLISEFCAEYKGRPECEPDYLNYLEQ